MQKDCLRISRQGRPVTGAPAVRQERPDPAHSAATGLPAVLQADPEPLLDLAYKTGTASLAGVQGRPDPRLRPNRHQRHSRCSVQRLWT